MQRIVWGRGDADEKTRFRGGPSVLLVERTDATRRLMVQALRPDYRVDAVATHEEARRRAEETRYDGIILSVHRRDVEEGIELTSDLQPPDASEGIPIILVCRPPLDQNESSLLDAGVDDVLWMPFATSDLQDMVGRHLR